MMASIGTALRNINKRKDELYGDKEPDITEAKIVIYLMKKYTWSHGATLKFVMEKDADTVLEACQ